MVGYLFDQDAAQRPSLHAVQPEHPLFKVGAKKPPFFLKYYQNARVPFSPSFVACNHDKQCTHV